MARKPIDFVRDHDPIEYVRSYYSGYATRAEYRDAFECFVAVSGEPDQLREWHERGLEAVVPE